MSDSSIVGVVLTRSPPIHQVQSGKASFEVYQSDMKGTEVTAVRRDEPSQHMGSPHAQQQQLNLVPKPEQPVFIQSHIPVPDIVIRITKSIWVQNISYKYSIKRTSPSTGTYIPLDSLPSLGTISPGEIRSFLPYTTRGALNPSLCCCRAECFGVGPISL
jgi:hypothetical protein